MAPGLYQGHLGPRRGDVQEGRHPRDNLIWVWTSDEAGDALDGYPGDEYLDIVGRDYYHSPRIANHGSLVAAFEKLKDIFAGRKLIALTENGSVPHPDSMKADGAAWSYFMPWYGDYTMDSWANDNTRADWNATMNHDFVITWEEMPGWDKYVVGLGGERGGRRAEAGRGGIGARIVLRTGPGWLGATGAGAGDPRNRGSAGVELYDLRGVRIGRVDIPDH